MKKNLLFIALLIITSSALGQKEANHWIAGWYGIDIDFNTSTPTVTKTAGVWPNDFLTNRGSSAISDKNGNLLLYSNSTRIWNKNDMLLPNGPAQSNGHNYDQGSVIVPLPGSDSIYYFFNISYGTAPDRQLLLSVIDMTLDGGNGDVMYVNSVLQKDVFCNVANTTGNVSAVRHANGRDLWIIVHDVGSNQFSSFLLDKDGWINAAGSAVIPPPVSSNVGTVVNFTYGNGCGINPSPDGTKIAAAYAIEGVVDLLDFDNATGHLLNPLSLKMPSGRQPLDAEFSPNNKVLYATVNPGGTAQWDLSSGDTTLIKASINWLPTSASVALFLAPNCKIYAKAAVPNSNKLDVINDPDKYGMDAGGTPLCGYTLQGLIAPPDPLMGVNIIHIGLPSIPLNIFDKVGEFNASTVCYGDSTSFSIVSCFKSATDTYNWNFDDAASGSKNTSTLEEPKHLYTKAGTFNVRLIITYNTGTKDTIINAVVVNSVPDVHFGNDTAICQGDHITLNAPPNCSYLWQDLLAGGSSSYLATIAPYTYWVTATDINGCKDRDTIFIDTYDAPVLANDTAICPGETILLSASANPDAPVLWNNSTTPSSTFLVTGPGTYWASICNMKDTIKVTAKDVKDCETLPPPPPPVPTVVSIPNTFTPNSDGQNDLFIAITATGITQMQTTIYDRWGKEVYSSIDPMIGWNGKNPNGKDAVDGTYFYIISYTANDGKSVTEKGTIQLQR